MKGIILTKKILYYALLLIALIQPATTFSSESNSDDHKSAATEKFNAGKMIIDHIVDAHDWHLWGEGSHAVSIPLPVIVYSNTRGLDVFLSSGFHHGHSTYNGYMLRKGEIVAVNETADTPVENASINKQVTAELWDLSITKNVVALLSSCIILIVLFTSVAKSYIRNTYAAPKGKQSLLEPLILFVRDEIAKPSIGPKYVKYVPYLLTAFFFIFINNLLGLVPIIPGGANLTGNIAVTMVLAVITLLVVSFKANGSYWRHIFAMPGVPAGVLLILTPIEILGFFLRPFVLMIRLFANITAGHIIALSFYSLIFIFGELNTGLGYGVSVLSIVFVTFMTVLELLVAFLQAYVFTLLSAMYIGSAIEEHHHDDHH